MIAKLAAEIPRAFSLLPEHQVPIEKIRSRYINSLKQLFEMSMQCNRVYFFDNTDLLVPFAEVNPNGFLDIKNNEYCQAKPAWFREHVLVKWNKDKIRILR